MNHSQAQIVVTLGPSSIALDKLRLLLESGLDVVRFNFAHGTLDEHRRAIENTRTVATEYGRHIPIIGDLESPQVEHGEEHHYDSGALTPISGKNLENIAFGIEQEIDYFAISYVSTAADIDDARAILNSENCNARIIAKIERKAALRNLEGIVYSADAVMIARENLANEIPYEQVPYIQNEIIKNLKWACKPVITATEMHLSTVTNPHPTRAEVSDVAYAIISGTDAVMLDEETATGNYPVESVAAMERIIVEAERHLFTVNSHFL